jgi:hypothetical protein
MTLQEVHHVRHPADAAALATVREAAPQSIRGRPFSSLLAALPYSHHFRRQADRRVAHPANNRMVNNRMVNNRMVKTETLNRN